MKKSKLTENLNANMADTKTALQTIWDLVNKGQQKQALKREDIKALLDRYGVEYES